MDVSFTVTQALPQLRVGDSLPLVLLGAKGEPVRVNLHVVGVDAARAEFPPRYGPAPSNFVWATPSFARTYGPRLLAQPGVAVQLRDVRRMFRHSGGDQAIAGGQFISDYPQGPQAANTEHSIHLQAVALWLLAAVVAVLGLLILGQLHARLTAVEQADFLGTLRAIGAVPRQLAAAGLARAALESAARRDAHGGYRRSPSRRCSLSDWYGRPSRTRASTRTGRRCCSAGRRCAGRHGRRGRVAGLAGGAGQGRRGGRAACREDVRRPAVRGAGRHAFRAVGSGRDGDPARAAAGRTRPTAVPVRSAIAATAVGVVGLTAALGFSASLGYLLATPRLYGVTWDALISDQVFATSMAPAARSVAADQQVAAWSGTYAGAPLTVNGTAVERDPRAWSRRLTRRRPPGGPPAVWFG